MAHIDNLIDSIKDESLRAALRAEYRKVTKGRQFGLVFDPHKPESVLLPKFKVRRGDKVRILGEGTTDRTAVNDSGVWIVMQINAQTGMAALQDSDGRTDIVERDRLVVTREFGDPIYPGLRSVARVQNGPTDQPWHSIINAENYHALEALLYPYEGKVDAIYIDPPYNTGAKDWKYNNDYVDNADEYRHSKWLSFMERRLKLTKRLLNHSDSVLIVTIDEKEYLRLGLLLEQVFPEARIQMISSVINPKGATRSAAFGRTDEYVYFVMFGRAAPRALPLTSEWKVVRDLRAEKLRWAELLRSGTNARREDRPALFYPVFVRNTEDGPVFDSVGESFLGADRDDVIPPEGCVAVWPIRSDGSEGNWQISPGALVDLIEQGYVKMGNWRGERTTIAYLKRGEQRKVEQGLFPVLGKRADGSIIVDSSGYTPVFIPGTQWRIASHEAGGPGGTSLLRHLIPGRRFPFPKSLYAVEDALRFFVKDKPDALILDFFGGSATTAHAVMRLNHEDGGTRRAIVVTNNEVSADEARELRKQGINPGDVEWEAQGIAESIAWPRVRAAVTGLTPNGDPIEGDYKFTDEFPMAEGFEENVEFFELTYEDPALVSLGRRFHAIAPLLWLKAGARGIRIDEIDTERGWSLPDGAAYGVLFDITQWAGFVEAVQAREDAGRPLSHAFVVSDSVTGYQQVVSRLSSSLDTTRLYADYLRTFEINTTNDDEVALVPAEKGSPAGSRPAAQKSL